MKNLLVLSYYFPPLGMSGVQRTLKFVKYLPENGWHPIVVTPNHRGNYGHDPALLAEVPGADVFRTFSLDPLFLSPPRLGPQSVNKQRGLINLVNAAFLPDNKIGWIPFAVAAGLRIARLMKIDAVYSTAPPYSSHVAAMLIARALRRPLITDYRDAWSQDNPLARRPARIQQRIDRWLEHCVTNHSRMVMAINQEIIDGLRAADPGGSKFHCIPHGFDPADFAGLPRPDPRQHFTIAYSGTFTGDRNPEALAAAVRLLAQERPALAADIRIVIAGAHRSQDPGIIERMGLADTFTFRSFLPHHECLAITAKADALWLVIGATEGPTVSSSKLYEYLGAGKPIIASIPANCAAARIIQRTNAGVIVAPGDHRLLAGEIARLYDAKAAGRSVYQPVNVEISTYDRRMIARQFARLLDTVSGA